MMIVRVFYVGKHITDRVNAFTQQLECPHLVEPQIVLRGKDAHNNTHGKGTDCHPQQECMQRWPSNLISYFHQD
jgi:hypothetical protein